MYPCQYPNCGHTFSSRHSAREHYAADHEGKRFICSSCNNEYARHGGYYYHRKNTSECKDSYAIIAHVEQSRQAQISASSSAQAATNPKSHGVHPTRKRITLPMPSNGEIINVKKKKQNNMSVLLSF